MNSVIDVAEFARNQGVSPRRAQQLAASGSVRARKVGSIWLIDEGELASPRRQRRALSGRSAAMLRDAIESGNVNVASGQERARLRQRLNALPSEQAPSLLRDWFRDRHVMVLDLAVNRRDLPGMRNDPRLVLGGISDERAALAEAAEGEAYVGVDEVKAVRADWLLVESDQPNVRLHVVKEAPPRPLPLAWLLADLADRGGPREVEQVRRLLDAHL